MKRRIGLGIDMRQPAIADLLSGQFTGFVMMMEKAV